MRPRILVIDDNDDIATALRVLLDIHGLDCAHAHRLERGLQLLSDEHFDLVIQDMNFTEAMTSGQEGVELFQKIRHQLPDLPIILITAWSNLESAVQLVKAGAADYMAKPWDDDKLVTAIRNLLELSELQGQQKAVHRERAKRKQKLAQQFDLCGLEFESDAMIAVVEMACKVARSDISVLITGPNGAGKEKLADIIQANSSCREGPFVRVNIAALSPQQMEAELFGAEAGAYTSSTRRRIGRFELADRGTLFLDEIGNLPLEGQTKLLRVLETGQFERMGGSETLQVHTRVISATNADLPAAIAEGSFREDLFYRLNMVELSVPPLKDRRPDILPLARHFLDEGVRLDDDACRLLEAHSWPGNVRELRNAIKRGALLCNASLIRAGDLGIDAPVHPPASARPEPDATDIEHALKASRGVVSEAAKRLGLSRSALYRRMKKFDMGDS